MAIVIKVWYLQFDKDAVWQKMENLCRKLAAFRQKKSSKLDVLRSISIIFAKEKLDLWEEINTHRQKSAR